MYQSNYLFIFIVGFIIVVIIVDIIVVLSLLFVI